MVFNYSPFIKLESFIWLLIIFYLIFFKRSYSCGQCISFFCWYKILFRCLCMHLIWKFWSSIKLICFYWSNYHDLYVNPLKFWFFYYWHVLVYLLILNFFLRSLSSWNNSFKHFLLYSSYLYSCQHTIYPIKYNLIYFKMYFEKDLFCVLMYFILVFRY